MEHSSLDYNCVPEFLHFVILFASDTSSTVTFVNRKLDFTFLNISGNIYWWAVDTISRNSCKFRQGVKEIRELCAAALCDG